MKLIMENWKRFLKEGVSKDIAAVIEYAVQKGLRRDTRPEEAAQIFADIQGEGSYAEEDVEAAYEDWELYDLGEVDPDLYERSLNEQDESMSDYELGAELRNMQMDTMHAPGTRKGQNPVIRMMDVVNIYGDTIEKAAKALDRRGKNDLAKALRAQLERAKGAVKRAEAQGKRPMVMYTEPDGAKKFYAIFDDAGDALMAAKSSEE